MECLETPWRVTIYKGQCKNTEEFGVSRKWQQQQVYSQRKSEACTHCMASSFVISAMSVPQSLLPFHSQSEQVYPIPECLICQKVNVIDIPKMFFLLIWMFLCWLVGNQYLPSQIPKWENEKSTVFIDEL